MKKALLSIFLLTLIKSGFAQGSYFTCNETGLYLSPSMVTISLPGQSKEAIKQKIMSFIRERKYLYKPFYSGDNQIAFRDFVKCGDKSDCGADLIAKNIFRLTYDSGFIKIRLENEIYSTFYGAELLINENDDVASRKDVPFAPYEFQVPEQYAAEYPEAMYTFNKKGKITLKSPVVQETLLIFYNRYITDMKTYLGGS
ncbi:MAG: hypothetical protein J0M10_14010 [Chitinophagales bacterium]|nr:hypothetical protein [Chitinophagales bacterium]